ncbi:transposase [Antarcticibacterium sp. 1MA-6-2]|uniref:transposase n=1 Tax=Antarcticibacterium sp. 1MA-6-2 TaxID=2908210 RepID=UPI001F426B87|nr:transposase [Antarcticibacterium sp. 1MA-6-2]UJH91409.1 transposase [Antarcticibacterium sp. 1MA-6-2]
MQSRGLRITRPDGKIKTKGVEYANFYWQDGYGAFSVKPSEVDRVVAYIANQWR